MKIHAAAGRTLAVLLLSGCVTLAVKPAWSADPPQSTGDTTDSLQEVVVTAQFRSQNLQETPIAITAVNAELLDQRSQTNIAEVANQMPNVTLKPAGANNGPSLIGYIRGVGQSNPSFALEPGVGLYVDDVYYSTLTGSVLDLLDLDRVEVLRGPQGTLAGKNSIGGAIKLFSQKPDDKDTGYVEGTFGSLARTDGRAAGNFVLVPDQVFVRVAIVSRHHDGYVTRLDYACTHPGSGLPTFSTSSNCVLGEDGGQDYTGGRIALRYIANDKLEINLSADRTQDDSPAPANISLYANHPGATLNGVPYDCRFVAYGPHACDTRFRGNGYINYETFTDPRSPAASDPYVPFSVPATNGINAWGSAGTVDYHYFLTLSDFSTGAGNVAAQPGMPREFAFTIRRDFK